MKTFNAIAGFVWAIESILRATGRAQGDWLDAVIISLAFFALWEMRGQLDRAKAVPQLSKPQGDHGLTGRLP